MDTIQELCNERKKALGKTAQNIADEASLPQTTVRSFFSSGAKSPTVSTTAAICAVLGISLDKFYGITEPPDDSLVVELNHEREKYALLLDTIDAQQQTIDSLHRSVKNLRHIIFALLVIIALLLIYGITLDVLNPDMGLFRGGM